MASGWKPVGDSLTAIHKAKTLFSQSFIAGQIDSAFPIYRGSSIMGKRASVTFNTS